jgi:mannonate dehydratase
MTRRTLVASAGLLSVPVGLDARSKKAKESIKLGMVAGPDPALLRFLKQIGIEWIATSLRATQGNPVPPNAIFTGMDGVLGGLGGPPGGPSGPWKEQELRQLIQRVETAGLRLGNVMMHSFPNAILGNSERDRDIERVQTSIRLAGRLGIPVVEYNFFGIRNVEGLYKMPGRGGATYRAFDASRTKDESAVAGVGLVGDDEMWDRLRYFVKAVAPVAEESHVRLALHPNDPPPPRHRGVAQPFATVEQWKRLVTEVPSPANGITLDTGVTAELGANVVDTIRYFGKKDRINHVHFRNVRTVSPRLNYVETFIDEGQVNMLAAMRALVEVGYSRMVVPDHTPAIAGDTNGLGAWGYALGYIRALLTAATA